MNIEVIEELRYEYDIKIKDMMDEIKKMKVDIEDLKNRRDCMRCYTMLKMNQSKLSFSPNIKN